MAADKNKKKRDASTLRDGHEATSPGQASESGRAEESSEPIVRDKRRIDPETGESRVSSDSTATPGEEEAMDESEEMISDDDIAKLLENAQGATDSSSEHLDDLKRVQAEYANYRKRVDRDRYLARDLAVAEVVSGILPVLDDLDLAHAHGDLEGSALELVAHKIRAAFERYGLVRVGAVGDVFDPNLHEAIAQLPSKDVTEETIADVILPGYQLGERLLRAAKVAVSVPEE